jgi:hypothetical protein
MRIIPLSSMTALALAAGLVSQAKATIVPAQKGSACSGVWDTFTATATAGGNPRQPWSLTCIDGDPTCDRDGQQNGACQIQITGCASSSDIAGCTPEPLTSVKFNGAVRNKLLGFLPVSIGQTGCGVPGTITLNLKGKKKNKPSKKVMLIANFRTTAKGQNRLRVQCRPVPTTGGTVRVCPSRQGLPSQITLTVPQEGTDLDNGWSGTSHNFPVIFGSQLKYCPSGCDTSSNPVCQLSGPTGPDSLNGETFGAPLPLFTTGVPVCVVNRYKDPTNTGTFNLQDGTGDGPVNLFSDVFLRTGQDTQVCPRCNNAVAFGEGALNTAGKCDATSAAPGDDCIIDGLGTVARGTTTDEYKLSSQCRPAGAPTATLDIPLNLTTATRTLAGDKPCPGQTGNNTCEQFAGSTCTAQCAPGSPACVTQVNGQCIDTKGGISQLCCSHDLRTPCFPSGPGGQIVRTGTPSVPQPAWPDPTYPKNTAAGQDADYVAIFCIAATGNNLIDGVTRLPGPGALILPSEIRVDAVQ